MRILGLLLALQPALVFAQETGGTPAVATTQTSTTFLAKTLTLARVHTVVANISVDVMAASNDTMPSITPIAPPPAAAAAGAVVQSADAGAKSPNAVQVLLAGVFGMLAAVLM